MNLIIIKTERLILRPIVAFDLDYIHELHSLEETDEFNTGNQIIGLIGINLGKVKYKNAEV